MKNEAGERLILNEEVRSEEVKTCFLCGATGKPVYMEMRDRLFDASGKWNILRCPGCGLFWLDPRPTREDNNKVYLNHFTHEEDVKLKPTPSSPLKKIKYYIIASYFGYNQFLDGPASRLMGKLSGLPPFVRERAGRKVMWIESCNRGKLLDIGCGQGKFLARMQNFGWNVSGVEPDAEAANIARERFGVEVAAGAVEKARFPDGHFEAVTMRHVIEHIHDPLSILMEVRRILKPGGNIIVTTPNAESMGHRHFGRSWFPLDPPRHLHLFSMSRLRACAERAGLQVKQMRTTAHAIRWIWAGSRLIERDGALPGAMLPELSRSIRRERKTFQLLENLLNPFWKSAGEELMMATKNHSGM